MTDEDETFPDGSTPFGTQSARQRLHDAIQAEAIEVDGKRVVLYGWVALVEWIDHDGHRWMSQMSTNASGMPAPEWQGQGYMHHALHDWPSTEDDD